MTARAAARRSGLGTGGPPSWKISSMVRSRLRTCTSGMNQAPVSERLEGENSRFCGDEASLPLKVQRRGTDEASVMQRFCDTRAGEKCGLNFVHSEVADRLRNEPFAKISVGREFAGRNARDSRVAGQINCVCDYRGGSI